MKLPSRFSIGVVVTLVGLGQLAVVIGLSYWLTTKPSLDTQSVQVAAWPGETVPEVAAKPQVTTSIALPPIPVPTHTAQAVLVIDRSTGAVLYEHQADKPLMPASTTKLVTALVAWKEYAKDELVLINTGPTIGQSLRFAENEQMSVHDLVKALLISSANDAALALANHYKDSGYQGFVMAMNQFARELKLSQSHFVNVSGLESPGHTMSARDLAIVADYLLSDPELAAIVDTTASSVTGESGQVYPLRTTNQLLVSNPAVYGIKTGWTDNAGECLVAGMRIDDRDVLTVVLGSQDRFGETEALLAWGDSVLRELASLR